MKRFRVAQWFLPGLGVKRWIVVVVIGIILTVNGLDRWLTEEGTHLRINEFVDDLVDGFFPPAYLAYVNTFAGLLLIAVGVRIWLRNIVLAIAPEVADSRLFDALRETRLRRGYRIVVVGGGTGLSTMLRGLKKRTTNLTAIVTVSDDGGSSGRLVKELGVLPPGDIRNCLVALADDEALVTDLFRYRFQEGEGLSGHSFGNLFLAAMTGITGNFDEAIKVSSRVLNVKGRVLPSTLAVARLCATLEDGSVVEGESAITASRGRIKHVFFDPPFAPPLQEVLDAVREADAIVLGPGSLYTSIMPNLLVDRLAREIEASPAVKIYVCNVMTQPGETEGYTASRHVQALVDASGSRVCDVVVVNDELPRKLREEYAEEGQFPVEVDDAELARLGVRVVRAGVISETQTVRHDPERLASVVVNVIDESIAARATFVRFGNDRTAAQPAS